MLYQCSFVHWISHLNRFKPISFPMAPIYGVIPSLWFQYGRWWKDSFGVWVNISFHATVRLLLSKESKFLYTGWGQTLLGVDRQRSESCHLSPRSPRLQEWGIWERRGEMRFYSACSSKLGRKASNSLTVVWPHSWLIQGNGVLFHLASGILLLGRMVMDVSLTTGAASVVYLLETPKSIRLRSLVMGLE